MNTHIVIGSFVILLGAALIFCGIVVMRQGTSITDSKNKPAHKSLLSDPRYIKSSTTLEKHKELTRVYVQYSEDIVRQAKANEPDRKKHIAAIEHKKETLYHQMDSLETEWNTLWVELANEYIEPEMTAPK